MSMVLSVRLDPITGRAVTRLARQRNQTKSAIVREAIAAFDRTQADASRQAQRRWDAVRHLIGAADSGGARLSEGTGAKVRAMLREKARARRAG